MRRGLPVAVCLLWASVARADASDSAALFTAARTALEGGPPAKAAVAVDAALRAGHHDPETTAKLYGMAGEVAAARGDLRAAETDFRRMLAIEPSARPRRSYAAQVGPTFDRAAAAAQKAGRLAVDVRTGDNGGVIVRVASDPIGVVSGAWAEYTTADEQTREVLLPGRGGTAFLLPGRKPGTPVVAGVVDEFGNRLAAVTLRTREAPVAATPDKAPPRAKAPPPEKKRPAKPAEPEVVAAPEPDETTDTRDTTDAAAMPLPEGPRSTPVYRRWPMWAGLATVAGAGALYFAWDTGKAEDDARAIAADSDAHSYEELVALEDRGRRSAMLTNVFTGGAAVLAVTSVVMAIWRDEKPAARPSGSVRLEVGRASVGLAVGF